VQREHSDPERVRGDPEQVRGTEPEIRPQPRLTRPMHDQGGYERVAKPILDRIAGVLLSIVTMPIVLVILFAIRARLGSPALFRQRRVGRFGQDFTVYKFRTMDRDRRDSDVGFSAGDRRVNHKSTADPRHTDVGRFLRAWSLDEIPQFWNVALGDMSLVGPRPELPQIVAQYEEWQHRRHEVKPGVTGLWQVSARGEKPMHEATDIDIKYVESVSFSTDLKILLHTPTAALGSQKGH